MVWAEIPLLISLTESSRDLAVISDGILRIVTGLGDSPKSMDTLIRKSLPELDDSHDRDPFIFTPASLLSLKRIGSGSVVCAVTSANGVYSVWSLVVSPLTATINSSSLMLTTPSACEVFDASITASRGVFAVCVVDAGDSSSNVLRPRPVTTRKIMCYSPVSGWTEFQEAPDLKQVVPLSVRIAHDGSWFLIIYQVRPWEHVVFHSVRGVVWRGRHVAGRSVSISADSAYVMWTGHDASITRPNSTHPRVFLMSCFDFSVSPVSEAGTLVISSGFTCGQSELWFTIQRGVHALQSLKVCCRTRLVKLANGPAIVGNSATQRYYRTESLDSYPAIFDSETDSRTDLPLSLPALCLTAVVWKHPRRPNLQGALYSVRGDGSLRPLVVHLHGGPAMAVSPFRRAVAESSDWFLPLINSGFDVLSITYTGSLGFGDEYAQGSIGKQGIVDLGDVEKAVEFFGSRITCILGGSYGGFLSMHAYCSPIFKEIKNFVALYPYVSSRGCAAETGDFAWESEYCGVEAENLFPVPQKCLIPDVLPKLYSADTSRRLLLFHGDADDVCPISQSRQIYHILTQRGSDSVQLVTYRGEGHGFRNTKVRADCISRIIDFLTPPTC